jgi:RNA polymerase sigma-70 factor (ECF subfamily)
MTGNGATSDRASRGGSTSRSLLADAQGHDPAAWTRLVNLYAPLVAAWCRRWGLAEQEIADVLQEVFAAVARNLGAFRKERPSDTFRGWLATITRNKLRDHYRQRTDQPAAIGGTEASLRLAQVLDPLSADESELRDDAAFSAVLQQALDSIRGEFHEATWKAFWAVVVDGQTTAEVASTLKMRPGTVRVAKSRVLHRLRRELGDIQE